MPFVRVSVAGELTREQKEKLADSITTSLEEIVGKPREATSVVFEEVSRSNWSKKGKLLE